MRRAYPFVQSYDWGKKGQESCIAGIIAPSEVSNGKAVECGANMGARQKPMAELWMGSHPNGPNMLRSAGGQLCDFTDWTKSEDSTEFFDKSCTGKDLPYLFKVLSVAKALSIQTHPNADTAKLLHAQFPQLYKDPNPKPEMAIALTPFRAIYGFRKSVEVCRLVNLFPSVAKLTGKGDGTETGVREMYSRLMRAAPHDVAEVIHSLLAATKPGSENEASPTSQGAKQTGDTEGKTKSPEGKTRDPDNKARDPDSKTRDLLLNEMRVLNGQFPGDVGVLSVLFMNVIELQPGEAIFIGPNIPHAYLSGDLLECMTCSDNVVRGGLTPKHKDVDTLLRILDYSGKDPAACRLTPTTDSSHKGLVSYTPPRDLKVPFAVMRIGLSKSEKSLDFEVQSNSPAIILCVSGQADMSQHGRPSEEVRLTKGVVYVLKARGKFSVKCDTSDHFESYLAYDPL